MRKDVLYVKMFGDFSITWNGTQVTGGARRKETQFAYLLQPVLHRREEGVSREELEEILFENREVSNIRHALRTVLYNARRRLKECGLPDVDYFPRKKERLYWTPEIEVCEDASEFDRWRALAEEADGEERLSCLLKACALYEGEFLEDQAGMLWVAAEARKYRIRYCACVEEAAGLLRSLGDYPELERLGRAASRAQPLSDWETLTMEALIALGRTEEARRLYDHTVDYYYREEGLRPSVRMLQMLENLGKQLDFGYAALEQIQAGLEEPGEEVRGGYFCPYPVFQGIYRMVERMMERGGQSVYLMLCTLVDLKGNPMKDGAVLERLSPRLEEAVCRSVRHGDAVTRYGKGQYIVLLINTNRENCAAIQRRISHNFITGRQRTGVEYYVSSVVCQTDRG